MLGLDHGEMKSVPFACSGFSAFIDIAGFFRSAEKHACYDCAFIALGRLAAGEQRTFHHIDFLAQLAVTQSIFFDVELNKCRTTSDNSLDERIR